MTTRKDIMVSVQTEATGSDPVPSWLQARLAWFQDLKFGLMLHWGPYSQWGCIESWPLVEEDTWARPDTLACWRERGMDLTRFRRDYWALNETFNPTRFDPALWAQAARYAGMRYVAFTTKHHDGFCMFDTRTTDYRITHSSCPFHGNPRANITRQVFDAFRQEGLGVSCYFSKSDWHSPYYWDPQVPARTRNPNYDTHAHPDRWSCFVDFVHRQVKELMTGYGPIDVLWLDGGQVRPPNQDIQMAALAAMARSHQPGLIVADRNAGGPYENILTPEQKILDAPIDRTWESCLTMGNSWSYVPDDTYKPARKLIHMLIDIVAKGGNFLLNVGPGPDGLLPQPAVDRLREIGDWMAVNSEAIHGTRPVSPYRDGNVCYTRKGDYGYAIVLAEEDKDCPPAKITLTGIRPAEGTKVHLLGTGNLVDCTVSGNGTELSLPTVNLPCRHAWTLRLQLM